MTYEKAFFEPKPDLGSSEDRLIERKQMSTKTLRKRIALVAVSALGFGVLATVPASAATVTNAYTTGSTLSTSSLTVVGTSGSSSFMGKFYVDVTSNQTLTDKEVGLFSDESITVVTTAAPAGVWCVWKRRFT